MKCKPTCLKNKYPRTMIKSLYGLRNEYWLASFAHKTAMTLSNVSLFLKIEIMLVATAHWNDNFGFNVNFLSQLRLKYIINFYQKKDLLSTEYKAN